MSLFQGNVACQLSYPLLYSSSLLLYLVLVTWMYVDHHDLSSGGFITTRPMLSPGQSWILDSWGTGPSILCQWNFDFSQTPSLAEFRIPWAVFRNSKRSFPWIPQQKSCWFTDSKNKNFPDSVTVHGRKNPSVAFAQTYNVTKKKTLWFAYLLVNIRWV